MRRKLLRRKADFFKSDFVEGVSVAAKPFARVQDLYAGKLPISVIVSSNAFSGAAESDLLLSMFTKANRFRKIIHGFSIAYRSALSSFVDGVLSLLSTLLKCILKMSFPHERELKRRLSDVC